MDPYDAHLPGSFVPSTAQRLTEQETVRQSVQERQADQPVAPPTVSWPPSGGTPINEFNTEGYISCAFPTWFQTGAADFVAPRPLAVTVGNYFKHLLLHKDGRYARASIDASCQHVRASPAQARPTMCCISLVIYSLAPRSQPRARSAISSYALEASSAILLPSRPSMFTRPKGLGDDLRRHFHKREGALIHYPCVVLTFFQPVPAPKEIDATLE